MLYLSDANLISARTYCIILYYDFLQLLYNIRKKWITIFFFYLKEILPVCCLQKKKKKLKLNL